jgi:UDP-N-acetylmuramate dehydrogenase
MSKGIMVNQNPVDMSGIGLSLEAISPGNVTANADLKKLSRWKIGGNCSWLVQPTTITQVSELVSFFGGKQIPYIVIGDGSNLLFDSLGLEAVVIKIGKNLSKFNIQGTKVISEAGVWIPRLARNIAKAGLGGIQHTIGIPGTLGGLACMNGGSQRRGIGDNIVSVTAVMKDGTVAKFLREECLFDYRESIFQRNDAIIVEVVMDFPFHEYSVSRKEMLDIMRSRRERFPLKLPNCGSVFVSNPKMYEVIGPPGKAIEQVGLKGFCIGGAGFSIDHANFIVNFDKASSEDVLALINRARTLVYEKTGYKMDTEVLYVSKNGHIVKPHTICDV